MNFCYFFQEMSHHPTNLVCYLNWNYYLKLYLQKNFLSSFRLFYVPMLTLHLTSLLFFCRLDSSKHLMLLRILRVILIRQISRLINFLVLQWLLLFFLVRFIIDFTIFGFILILDLLIHAVLLFLSLFSICDQGGSLITPYVNLKVLKLFLCLRYHDLS